MKFLLVDAEFDSRKQSQKALNHYGECDLAINGLEALNAFVRAHNDRDPYSLIFLDIDMPDLSGNQVLMKIRQWERSKAITTSDEAKIIMLSKDESSESKKTIQEALGEGGQAYILKPINRKKLAKAFKEINYI